MTDGDQAAEEPVQVLDIADLSPEQRKAWENGELAPFPLVRGKALIVGINYINSTSELQGCIKDALDWQNHIMQHWGFPRNAIRILSDDQHDPRVLPTRGNILEGLAWLAEDAKAGDSLFFSFSGHGTGVEDTDGDEDDGMDSALVSFELDGSLAVVLDDEINDIIVRNMPYGARVTVICDACMSGSIADLPFTYATDGTCTSMKSATVLNLKKGMKQALGGSIREGSKSIFKGVLDFSKTRGSDNTKETLKAKVEKKGAVADVICISGCEDLSTSADNHHSLAGPQGALSGALRSAIEMRGKDLSYQQLLKSITDNLAALGFTQVPQLSTSRFIDIKTQKFAL